MSGTEGSDEQRPGRALADEADCAMPDDFRTALRRLVAPVSVVTTLDGLRPWGMTVSAFTVVCLDPPTMAICVNRHTATADHIVESGRFGLNVLNLDQVALSQRCAAAGEAKHLDTDVLAPDTEARSDGAVPVLADAVVAFDCDAEPLDVAGSHLVVLARVRRVHAARARIPLLYGDGAYQRPCSLVTSPPAQM